MYLYHYIRRGILMFASLETLERAVNRAANDLDCDLAKPLNVTDQNNKEVMDYRELAKRAWKVVENHTNSTKEGE